MPLKKTPARKAPVKKSPARRAMAGAAPALPKISNYRIFEIKYLGPGYSTGSRVKINDLRFQESKTIPYMHEYRDTFEIAQAYLRGLGIKLDGKGEGKDSYIAFTKNFETSIKSKK
jgi:hypothetical protein